MTRRQLLGTGAAAMLGYALRGPLVTTADRILGYRPALAAPATGPAVPDPVAPFTLTDSSTLVHDVFTTTQVTLPAAADGSVSATVVPVAGDAGVRAVVQSADGVSLLHPDPTAPAGRVFTAVNGLSPDILGVVAAARPDGTTALGYWTPDATSFGTAVLDGTGVLTTTDVVSLGGGYVYPATQYRASFATDGTPSFAGMAVDGTFTQYGLVVTDPVGGASSVSPVVSAALAGNEVKECFALTASIANLRLVVGVLGTASDVAFLLVGQEGSSLAPRPVTAGGTPLESVRQLLAPFVLTPRRSPDAALALLWTDPDGAPWAAAVGQDGAVLGAPVPLLHAPAYGLSAPTVTQASWFEDPTTGSVTVHLLAEGGRLWVQQLDLGAGTATTPVPIADDVRTLDAPQVGRTSDTSLYVTTPSAELDGTVVVATLDRSGPTAPWVVTPVHTTNDTHLDLTAYRTVLTVTDANGRPVAGHALAVTPDVEVSAFDGLGGRQLPAGTATTLSTDGSGQVTIASPATALTSAQLQVVHDTGAGTETRAVAPDGELHTFLSGTGSLNTYASVPDLVSANAGPGRALSQLPTDAASTAAVAAAVTAAVRGGFAATTGSTGTAFTLTGLDTARPVYTADTPPPAQLLGSWWDDVEADAKSVWHAVERGVAAVSSVQSWYEDATGWIVQLALDIEGYVGAQIRYAITDLRSAMVAVHGIFQALGADVVAALEFLRTELLDLFAAAQPLADTLNGWLTATDPTGGAGNGVGLGAAYAGLHRLQGLTDGAFARAETQVEDTLHQLQGLVAGQSVAGQRATTIPPDHQAATAAASDVRASYLLQKVRTTPAAPPLPVGDATAATLADLGQLEVLGQQVEATITQIQQVVDTDDPQGMLHALTFDELVAQVLLTAADVSLHLLDDAADALFSLLGDGLAAFQALFATDLDTLPLLGDLFRVLGLGDLTFGEVFSYLVAVPVVAVGDVLWGRGWLPTGLAAGPTVVRGSGPQTWRTVLEVVTIVVNLFSIPGIVVNDVEYETEWEEAPPFLVALDIVFEVLVNLVAYPFAEKDTTGDLVWAPIGLDDDNALLGAGGPLMVWGLGFLPAVFDIVVTRFSRGPGVIVDQTLDKVVPALQTALGLFLVANDVLLAIAYDEGPVAITLGVVSWVSLVLKVFRYGRQDQYVAVSFVFDIGNPPAVVWTTIGALIAGK